MLKEELANIKRQVDPIINKALKKDQKRFDDLTSYQINTGGKRVRPFLLVNFYQGLGGNNLEKALKLAAALEIFHNYTLLIDDIIDKGETRRGKETTWKKWGSAATMCISSFYFSSVVHLLKEFTGKEIDLFSKYSKEVMEGEMIDILQERGHRRKENFYKKYRYKQVSLEDYKEMVNKKTAALFKLSCGAGASLAGKKIKQAESIGEKLGICYQIKDDILDIFGDEKDFGKQIGKDILERKGGNLVLLFAQEENKKLTSILNQEEISKKDLKEAMKIIEKTKAKSRAEELLEKETDKTLQEIKNFPENDNFKLIIELIKFIKSRKK